MLRLGKLKGVLPGLFTRAAPTEIPENQQYFGHILEDWEYGNTEVISVTGHDCSTHIISKREGKLGRVKSKDQVRQELSQALGSGNNTAYIELFNFVGETSKLRHLKGFKVESPVFAHIRERSLEQDISMG